MARQIPEVSSLVRCVVTNFFNIAAPSRALGPQTPLTVSARFVRLTEWSGLDRRLRERTLWGWTGRTRIDIPGRASQRVAEEEGEDDPAD